MSYHPSPPVTARVRLMATKRGRESGGSGDGNSEWKWRRTSREKDCLHNILFPLLLLFDYPLSLYTHTHTHSERRTTNYSKFVEHVCVLLWPPLLLLPLPLLRCNSILQSESESEPETESESESEHAEVNVLPDSYNSFQGDNKSKINKSQESCEQWPGRGRGSPRK